MAKKNDRIATIAPLLFLATLLLFVLTNYGGVRSPDSEIVFRVGESIASLRGFDVEELAVKGHGVAEGQDGKLYSLYGPVESLVLAPLIALAREINESRWYEAEGRDLPLSFYSGDGLFAFLNDGRPSDPKPHAIRYLASYLNPVTGAACVVLFFLILGVMVRPAAALSVTTLYAVGTLVWHYSGTFFSEQLTALLLLLSFYLLVLRDPRFGDRRAKPSASRLFGSGLVLALAFATHITALLFAPFYGLYALWLCRETEGPTLKAGRLAMCFVAGFGIILLIWGYFNSVRFGSFFETGRTLTAQQTFSYGWGALTLPWHGIPGLLIGSGKGLFFFCPAVLWGIWSWGKLHRRHAALSLILAAAALSRVSILGTLALWHGGFCLGPRYLVVLIPFLLLPSAFWVEERLERGGLRGFSAFAGFAIACAVQQLYFVLGELFSYYHMIKWRFSNAGIDVFARDQLYLDWKLTPLFQLHDAPRAPFLLRGIELSNLALWQIGSALLAVSLAAFFWLLWRQRMLQRKSAARDAEAPRSPV
jgi:hypothetical protein